MQVQTEGVEAAGADPFDPAAGRLSGQIRFAQCKQAGRVGRRRANCESGLRLNPHPRLRLARRRRARMRHPENLKTFVSAV